jgi:hypothetical protein
MRKSSIDEMPQFVNVLFEICLLLDRGLIFGHKIKPMLVRLKIHDDVSLCETWDYWSGSSKWL